MSKSNAHSPEGAAKMLSLVWKFTAAIASAALLAAPASAAARTTLQAGSTIAAQPPAKDATLSIPVERLNVPDFSFVGRDAAAAEPPTITPQSHAVFDVASFGAVANDGLSDRAAIEAAIAAAEATGQAAVVQFPAGRFDLRMADEVGAGPIRIRGSQIVLKGAGMYGGGTELFIASESVDRYAFRFEPDLDPTTSWRGFRDLTPITIHPAFGDREVTVADASAIQAGDVVRLSAVLPDTYPEFRSYFGPLTNESSIQDYFDNASGGGFDWRSDFLSTMEVESVTGNVVRFTQPLYAHYEFTSPTYKGGPKIVQIFRDGERMMQDSGVEDLAFVTNYRDKFYHFFNRAADGYNFLIFEDARDCWVRRVRIRSATRAIYFAGNGRSNVVYDVTFEGNSGHYSITTEGNSVGNQASFLRESAPYHHGFGATSSAFGTVYHRCNQFGGPEGHGGYPQSTLYDCNEGDLSLSRIGGAPPHQGRLTVFWNWNQDWLVPNESGLQGNQGRYLSRTLENRQVSFWPDRVVQPLIAGLHGIPANIDDEAFELTANLAQGLKIGPSSLFEGQLRARLGRVPRWIARRTMSFEGISRYTQVQLDGPLPEATFGLGDVVTVGARLHPKFDRQHLGKLQLFAARGHDLDFPTVEAAVSTDQAVTTLSWTPTAPGPWRYWLTLTNSLGEEFSSEPQYLFVPPKGEMVEYATPTAAWLQPRTLDPRAIMLASAGVDYVDRAQYLSDVAAIEQPLVQPVVDFPTNVAVGDALIDGNTFVNATSPAGLRFFGAKGLVLDLGAEQRVDFVELAGVSGSANDPLFGIFDVQVSSDPDAQYSYTNSDLRWRTVRRFGHARMSKRLVLDDNRAIRLVLPEATHARYVRLMVRTIDSVVASQSGNLSELRAGRFTGL